MLSRLAAGPPRNVNWIYGSPSHARTASSDRQAGRRIGISRWETYYAIDLAMKLPRLTWKRGLLVLILTPLAWLAYRTCPCVIQDSENAARFRVTSQPGTCAVFAVPTFWVLPDSTAVQPASDVEFYELRTSRHETDGLFVSLRSMRPYPPVEGRTTLRSKNKFAFRFHPAGAKGPAKVDGSPFSHGTGVGRF